MKKIIFLFFISPILMLFISNYLIVNHAKDKTFTKASETPKNKVGLVLGTTKILSNGRVNQYFKYRIEATVALYRQKKIDFILISGDNSTPDYDEPTDFKNELLKYGIPAKKIFLDYAGFRTLDSVVRAKAIFGQHKITIISQKFHNERALYLAKKHGVDAIGFNARKVSRSAMSRKVVIREYFARAKVFVDLLLGVQPKFLGEKVVIK